MKNKNYFFLLGLFFMLIPYFFWFFLGEQSFALIHDNLDSELVYITKIIEENATLDLGSGSVINGIMNGIPRGLLRSGLNLTFILFSLLPPVYAYIVNHLIVHLIGYIGMFLLLKKHFVKESDWLVALISLCFGFLSYYHIQYGISIAGQPILLFAFLNILYSRQKWYDWVIICLFPFYSFLVTTLPFIIPFLICIGLGFYYKNRQFPKLYFLAMLFLVLINLLVEVQLIYTTFFQPDIISHRVDWNRFVSSGQPTFKSMYERFIAYLKETHYHSGILDVRPIIGLLIGGVLFRKLRFKSEIRIVVISIFFILFWVSFNPYLVYLFRDVNIVKTFNSERFYFLLPFLWLLLLALILDKLKIRFYIKTIAGVLVLCFYIYTILDKNIEYKNNTKAALGFDVKGPNFNQFYAPDLFHSIKTFLGEDEIENYNFVSLGIFPNIAQYNGFKTLDSYQNNYELSYKYEFRKLIDDELEKNEKIKNYFDFWGSRCYVFSSELGRKYMFPKKTNTKVKNLAFDSKEFKRMNGKYLLSSVPVVNHEKLNFKFLKLFETSESYWKLYLYQAK